MNRRPTRRQIVQGAGLVGGALVAGCGRLPWQAQAPPRVPRIGYLDNGSSDDPYTGMLGEGLRDLGYREGQNLVIEYRHADGNAEQFPRLAAGLAALHVELIVARGTASIRAAMEAAPRTPIVMAGGGGDAVGTGLITSFARPGGNVTGVTTATIDFAGKWLELLKEALPTLSRVAILSDPQAPANSALRELERVAERLQVRLQYLEWAEPEALPAAFSAMGQEHAEAVIYLPGSAVRRQRSRIAALALANRLPSVAGNREFPAEGGLMSYGTSTAVMFRRAAVFVDKILKGAKPADLPVERPMRFEFVVNLKTAQALGLTLPYSIMLQATEVIQ